MTAHDIVFHMQYDTEQCTRVYTLICGCGEQDKLRIPDIIPFQETIARLEEAAKALAARPGASPMGVQTMKEKE